MALPHSFRFVIGSAANAHGITRARWSKHIVDEVRGAILKNRPDLDPRRIERTMELMSQAVRDALVSGYEELIAGLSLPDPNDRHVLAAAIRCHAQLIVTSNLDDFPAAELSKYGIEARDPDSFVVDQIHLAPARMYQLITEQAAALGDPPMTVDDVLDSLARNGLLQAVALLRAQRESF